MRYNEYTEEEWYEMCERFQDPGGNSALHRVSKKNPRNLSCPTCGKKNRLTRKDVQSGYQCDECADRLEMGY